MPRKKRQPGRKTPKAAKPPTRKKTPLKPRATKQTPSSKKSAAAAKTKRPTKTAAKPTARSIKTRSAAAIPLTSTRRVQTRKPMNPSNPIKQPDAHTEGSSENLSERNLAALRRLFPDAFTEAVVEGKVRNVIDFDVLRRYLGDSVEEGQERYSLNWSGKSRARRMAQTPSTGTLRPALDESENWANTRNLFIEGDNLEVLKLLQKAFHRQVKLIYIDPPYNTGKDFVYPDDFASPIDNYLRLSGQRGEDDLPLSPNSETSGRFHTTWLNMMLPRLRLARNLLHDEGLICISIDDNEIANLKLLCNELFGEECFVGQVTVLCNPKGRSHDKYLATCHEYLLIYSKTVLSNGAVDVLRSAEEISEDFPLSDGGGRYREMELRNTHREFGKHNRPNLYYPFYVSKDGVLSLIAQPASSTVLPIWEDGFEGCWTWGPEKAAAEISKLIAKRVGGVWKVYRKAYAAEPGEESRKQLKSIWAEKRHHTEKGQAAFNALFDAKEKLFQSPKSLDVIRDLLAMTRDRNAIVLDFFVGSGTTAHAVVRENRESGSTFRFIVVQLPELCPPDSEAKRAGYETIADLAKERIRRAIKETDGLLAHSDKSGDGFRVFKLDSSNIKPWDADFDTLEQAVYDATENIKADRSEQDVLYELLLKFGLDLCVPIEERKVAGKTVFSVGAGALMVCLDKKITLDVVEGIAKLKEELKPEVMRVVFRDSGFKDDVVKTNAVQILKQVGLSDEHIRSI